MTQSYTVKQGNWSYTDYLSWPENERWEIIDGVAYARDESLGFRENMPMAMSPAPSIRHQEVSGELFRVMANYFHGKPCKVFAAPLDVQLQLENEAFSIVQPDILVVCDLEKLQEQACVGAPNLIVEVVSPASARQDYVRKLNLYEKHGVAEYWIVHPIEETVMAFSLDGIRYGRPQNLAAPDHLHSTYFPGLKIDLHALFEMS